MLYLLHGLTDDHTGWQRYTSIERYADEAGLAVVMPAVHHSFYTDEVHGHAYWTYVSEELPALVHRLFRVSDRPEDTFAAGLSMGGYGAVKLALSHPDRYAAAASLSGTLDITYMADREDRAAIWDRAFGGEIRHGERSVRAPRRRAVGPAALHRLRHLRRAPRRQRAVHRRCHRRRGRPHHRPPRRRPRVEPVGRADRRRHRLVAAGPLTCPVSVGALRDR